MRSRAASTKSLAAIRGLSRQPWSPASAIFCPAKLRKSSARREYIITISGVQMTLVAAIFFVGLRRLLALSQTLALSYPIKKWAALFAIAGAIFYDIATGSRVGTERAL